MNHSLSNKDLSPKFIQFLLFLRSKNIIWKQMADLAKRKKARRPVISATGGVVKIGGL
jgi:hypothetical protein